MSQRLRLADGVLRRGGAEFAFGRRGNEPTVAQRPNVLLSLDRQVAIDDDLAALLRHIK